MQSQALFDLTSQHDALQDLVASYKHALRYFEPNSEFTFIGDVLADDFSNWIESKYDQDSSDNAALILEDLRKCFAIYKYQMTQIQF